MWSLACSDSVRDLIGRILVQDPNQRPTLQVGASAACLVLATGAIFSASLSTPAVLAQPHVFHRPGAGDPVAPVVHARAQSCGTAVQRRHRGGKAPGSAWGTQHIWVNIVPAQHSTLRLTACHAAAGEPV